MAEIDPETKASLEELMKMGKRGRVPPGFHKHRYEAIDPLERETYTERLAREERERAERVARDAAYHAEREREEARYKAEEKAALEAEREEVREKYEQLFCKGRFRPSVNLRDEIAVLSINPSKACIVMRAVVTQAFAAEIERVIPAQHRKELDDVWEFHPSVLPKLKQLLGTYYKEVQVIGVPKTIPSTKFDKLMNCLDKEDRNKVYRLLAAKYHPDVKPSGSHEVMTLINEVFK